MKKYIIGISLFLLLCVAFYFVRNSELYKEQNMESNCSLIVNGIDITEDHYVMIDYEKEDFARLPIVAILESLGAEIKWNSKTKATICFDDNIYVLNTRKETLINKNNGFDAFLLPPGSEGMYYNIVNGEVIIDSNRGGYIISLMGGTLHIDCESATVTVDDKSQRVVCKTENHKGGSQPGKMYLSVVKKACFKGTITEDHVHCELCWKKIGVGQECSEWGYCLLDNSHWICEQCFGKYKEMFKIELQEDAE